MVPGSILGVTSENTGWWAMTRCNSSSVHLELDDLPFARLLSASSDQRSLRLILHHQHADVVDGTEDAPLWHYY